MTISKKTWFLISLIPITKITTLVFFPTSPIPDILLLIVYIAVWLYAAGSLWDDNKFQKLFGPNITHGQAMAAVFVGLLLILMYAFFFSVLYISPALMLQ